MMQAETAVAYFSMEIGLQPDIPTYAGGLGMLAGDMVRAAADQGMPLVAVSLLYRKGYFAQHIDEQGWQRESPQAWSVEDHLAELPTRCVVAIEGRTVVVRAWRYVVTGVGGGRVQVLLLDTDVEPNSAWDRTITNSLYDGDDHYRLCQEVILGVGGVRMLRALGYTDIRRYHMNEGHAAMLVVELLSEQREAHGHEEASPQDIEAVRERCVFTTHTPVAAAFDQFPIEMVQRVLGDLRIPAHLPEHFCIGGRVNLTYLALANSGYINGVAKRHRETAQQMFAAYRIDSITNGVHAATWVCEPLQRLFDLHIPGWRIDNASLRYALSIPRAEIVEAHNEAKRALLDDVERLSGVRLAPDVMTIGFARRATQYKRFELLFDDVDRLMGIHRDVHPIQIILGGKAHPADTPGKVAIQHIVELSKRLRGKLEVVYLEDYDMAKAQRMISGCDLWLNTPQPPLEASGTSGMKAALNGVPSLSVLDGWWIEGCIEGVTGWSLDGTGESPSTTTREEAHHLYDRLADRVLPLFYETPDAYVDVMRHAIALNGSFFNAQRMIGQYMAKAYF
jgi:starch phosphorylase